MCSFEERLQERQMGRLSLEKEADIILDKQLKSDLETFGSGSEYDGEAKRLLAHKIILAHILVSVAEEFEGMRPEDVVPLIEGEPQISNIPVNPGQTNEKIDGMPVITGIQTESKVHNEGSIYFDVCFYVWAPGKQEKLKIIVDVEAQKEKPSGYDIVTRGIFYNARQISAQLDTEFQIPYYNDLKKVYSIWICMNMPKYLENTAVEYRTGPRNLVGNVPQLGTLFTPKLQSQEKIEVLTDEYGIEMKDDMEGGINYMCNLSEAIEADAKIEAYYALVMDKLLAPEEAAKRLGMTVEEFMEEGKWLSEAN